jgi:hypothetical protein
VGGAPVWRSGLAWLEGQRGGFALPRGEAPDLFRLKALGELAAIAEVLWRRRQALPEAGTRARALLEFAWDEFERGETFARVLDVRPYPVLGTMYAVFERLGWRHEPTRERLARLGQPGALKAGPRPPEPRESEPVAAQYGADGVAVLCLGLALAWERLGLAAPWQRGRLYPLTRLARQAPGLELSVPDAYSLTHTVFFMTDWGAQPEGVPANERAYLAERVPGWMQAFHAQRHFDLYAELAAVLCCVALPPPAEAEDVLAGAREEDGSIRGHEERVQERTRGLEDTERRRFVAAYHTTLAGTLASFGLGVGLARAAQPAAAAAATEGS